MKILVTGAAGFIGSHVSEALLKEGHDVIGVDNLDPYYDIKAKEDNLKLLKRHRNFIFYKEDIRDAEALRKIFSKEKPDKVAHLAAKAGVRPSMAEPETYRQVNVSGTENLLKLACEFRARNFVFGSSSSVYGLHDVPFREDAELEPISPYADTKKQAEELCRQYHEKCNMPVTILRFFTVYGPRGRPDMAVYKFTALINEGKQVEVYGDGETSRDYTYVDDIVSGVVAALEKNYPFEIFNLGNSATAKLRELISTIEKALGKKAKIKQMPMQPGDVPITYADISKSRKMLGYNPKTRIEEGVRKFVEWYKRH
ncbi:GDP-mannose 4,6-dehydratase [Candidatus Woesearchaeota archaeon]|nr:GDP-mannose 4,6-dehydratase [Candidatus Woesearchaeota archaeon]